MTTVGCQHQDSNWGILATMKEVGMRTKPKGFEGKLKEMQRNTWVVQVKPHVKPEQPLHFSYLSK